VVGGGREDGYGGPAGGQHGGQRHHQHHDTGGENPALPADAGASADRVAHHGVEVVGGAGVGFECRPDAVFQRDGHGVLRVSVAVSRLRRVASARMTWVRTVLGEHPNTSAMVVSSWSS
jgi:hypothetical protein